MGRQKTPSTITVDADVIAEGPGPLTPGLLAVRAEHDAIQANVLALADELGYEGSLTVGALEDEIRFYQRRSVEAVMALGTRLLLLKEMTAHGEFSQRVELLGINERMARRFMSATLKFGKTDSKSVLIAAGNQTKLLELVVLDDEEIAELAEGGSAANLTLDEVSRMTVSELRAALREARENEQATGRVLQEKNAKIDQLAAEANKKKPATDMWSTRIAAITDEISGLGTVGDEVIGKHLAFLEVCEVLADELDPDDKTYRDKLEQTRVPIARLGEQLTRWGHLIARLQFEFENRLSIYTDNSHVLEPAAAE